MSMCDEIFGKMRHTFSIGIDYDSPLLINLNSAFVVRYTGQGK